ncbi:MAG: acetyl-CoA carboxylase biotin carboxyl carrier protein [Candidatus Aminicenantes bacterium]|nr:acetyl-CoA carboxylase biotin carboxyl carrier protein [Candidatus Aminicenantes bacterium]
MKSKIDYQEIIKLINLLEEKNLTEFELEVEGFRVKIVREKQSTSPPVTTEEASPPPGTETPTERVKTEVKNNLHYITSPMVGTFYRAPNPSAPPFVEIGDTVKKNQTLCIIEAMKLMNEIEADIDGVIEEVLVENGQPVEFGQKLFALKPLKS